MVIKPSVCQNIAATLSLCCFQEERKNRDPLKVLKSDQKQIELVRWEPVGNYAVRLDWSDGHNTGIYTYEYLRQLSEDA
jgi:DUF971 family protein